MIGAPTFPSPHLSRLRPPVLLLLLLSLPLAAARTEVPAPAYFDAPVSLVTAPQGEDLGVVLRALARAVGAHPIIHGVPPVTVELDLERPISFRLLWSLLLDLHGLEGMWWDGDVVVVMPKGPPPAPPPAPHAVQRLVRLDHANAERVAVLLNAGEAERNAGRALLVAEPISNLLLVTGSAEAHTRIGALIAELDRPPRRVALTLWLLEVSRQALIEGGIELHATLPGGLSFAAGRTPRLGWAASDLLPGLEVEVKLLDVLLAGDSKRLEQAQLSVLDGQAAHLFVGGRFNLLVGADEREVVVVPYGLDLMVTPRLLRDGRIHLDIQAQIDDLVARSDLNIGSRSLVNQAIVAPGELLLLGGWQSRVIDTQQRRTPGWSDIPLLGTLFRQGSDRTQERELLLLAYAEALEDR
jgi:type II secretory pathway component GspD/PulD (secretin)